MAKHRLKVPDDIRTKLSVEARGKCANPGCSTFLTELHHIREWAIYRTHDLQHMIAICPTCHGYVHRGQLRIPDSRLYEWKKQLQEPTADLHTGLYIEPSENRKLYLGFIGVVVAGHKVVLEISAGNRLAVAFEDKDLVILDLTLTASEGTRFVRVRNGIFSTQRVNDVQIQQRTGLIELFVPETSPMVPRWLLNRLGTLAPNYPDPNRVILFRGEVLEPGKVRIEGIWAQHDRAIVAYPQAIHMVSRTHRAPITLLPPTEGEVTFVADSLPHPLFGFIDEPAQWAFQNLNPRTGPIAIDPAED